MANPTEPDGFNTFLDLKVVPITALGPKSRLRLSTYLNKKKILFSENSYPRDWRGIFDLSLIPKPYFQALEASSNPMQELLVLWQEEGKTANLGQLQKCLIDIDRIDCLDDCKEFFDEDAKSFYRLLKTPKMHETTGCIRKSLLTIDDTRGAAMGLPPQQYDAMLIYAEADEEDSEFAALMMRELTELRDLKICSNDSILGGSPFEHDAKRTLLTKRCHRLIVILSNAFTLNNQDTYLANLAQSMGIENQTRKLIPCVYKKCDVIPELFKHMTILNYERSKKLNNFWDRLYQSVKLLPTPSNADPKFATLLASRRNELSVETILHHQNSKSTLCLQRHHPVPPPSAQREPKSSRIIYPPTLPRRNSISMIDLSSGTNIIPQSQYANRALDEVQKKKSTIKALLDKFTKKDKNHKVAMQAPN